MRNIKQHGYSVISLDDWYDLCTKYHNRCVCCGEAATLTIDHINPLKHGGTDALDNLQPLCASCNSRKGANTIDYRHNSIALTLPLAELIEKGSNTIDRYTKLSTYLSPAELQAIRVAAAHAGQSMSDYARSVLLTTIGQPASTTAQPTKGQTR